MRAVWCLFLCACPIVASAQSDDSAAGIQYFEKHIRPLLVERCFSCHSESANKTEGNFRLDQPDHWLKGGDRGAAVIPGDPDASSLIQAVRYTDADFRMPPTERLPDDAIAKLEHWVKLGAPAPVDVPPPSSTHPSDPIAGKTHWAFQPLAQTAVPTVSQPSWPRSDVDRFLLAKLDQNSLAPVEDATPEVLIRRLSLLLTGLPPSADHRARYSAAPTPETLAQITDELLASPQYGQRWGRHWLDLARYADSNGLDENFLFREAWRYRNWVIDAVNADMPYDRFLLEQLAGDLLPYDSIEQRDRQRIAAGFLVVGPKVLLGVNPDRQRMDVADEQIETVGRVVLGQTIGCARCHDHKFDPIPTRDYYALAGIFTSTRVMEQRYMLNEQRVMEQLIGLGEGGEAVDEAYEAFWRELPERKAHAEKSKAVLDLLQQKNEQAIAERLAQDGDGFAESARNNAVPIDERIAAQQTYLNEQVALLSKPPAIPPRAMIPRENDTIHDEAIRKAGQFDQPGDVVPRGFLSVLIDDNAISMPAGQSGRMELAQWLTNTNTRAGWLAARVQANRVWYHLMGRGLVRTVDNFGRTGETPAHPELLDYLAEQLIADGWSTKKLVRRIVLSRVFALSARLDQHNHSVDPDNILMWRFNRRRLDAESIRDTMLTAAGTLDVSSMESTVSYLGDQATAVGNNAVRRRTDFPCRSVYLPVIRNDLPELFEVFDFANPHFATGARPGTTVPTQGLYLLNDAMVMSAARDVARHILEESSVNVSPGQNERRINRMFDMVLCDAPTNDEKFAMLQFLDRTMYRLAESGDPEPELSAMTQACHALMVSSRFLFVE